MAYTVWGVSSGTVPSASVQDEVNAITSKHFDKTLAKTVYEDSVFFARLQKKNKIKVKGGTKLHWTVRVAELGTADSVDPRASVSWSSAETRKGVEELWKFYYATTLMTWDEIMMNRGGPQIVGLIKDKASELSEDMRDKLIGHLFATAASDSEKDLVPLNEVIGTSSYAGLDPSTLSDSTRWKSQVDSTATEVYLYPDDTKDGKSLSEMITSATFGKSKPTIILVTEDIFDTIEGIIDPRHRISDEGTVKLGFDNITFKGIPIVADTHMPSGYIFGIDEDVIEWCPQEGYDMKPTEWKPHEDYPNALYKGMSFAGALKSKTRHTHFKFSNIS